MRIYDRWYKELWWFIVENKMWVFTILLGVILGFALGNVLVDILEGQCN